MKTKLHTQTVTLSIDNQEVTVPKGTTILEAAKGLGVEIPTLCHLKELAPDGSCRMCVVEVEGGRRGGLTTACTRHIVKRTWLCQHILKKLLIPDVLFLIYY